MAEQPKAKPKKLEDEVKFSWMNVIKGGIRNMRDDIDPMYKGTKMGLYALHAIPTWHREYKDGKLTNDSHGWATIAGLFVGGITAAGYYFGAQAAVQQYGTEGLAVLGIPVAAQGLSYTREAFRRARKEEHAKVILTRIQRTGAETSGEYDLTTKDLLEKAVVKISAAKQEELDLRVQELKTGIRPNARGTIVYTNRMYEALGDVEGVSMSVLDGRIEQYRAKQQQKLDEMKSGLISDAQAELAHVAREVFNGLFADDSVGSSYQAGIDLKTGPKKRRRERDEEYAYGCRDVRPTPIAQVLREEILARGGSANVEAFGRMTLVYDGKKAEPSGYQVVPNKLWKK